MSESIAESGTVKGRSAPKGKPTPRAKDSHVEVYRANYKAKVQWYIIAALIAVAIVAAIILLSVYTGSDAGIPG